MKRLILLLTILLLQISISAQIGADITGLIKINGIQENNTNLILLTDGNGNLGYTTFSNLSNVGMVVTTTLNTAVPKTQINQNAKFRNLPNAMYNRVVTLDTNGSLGYRTFASLANSTTNLSGALGLNATNLINLTTNIFSSPTSYTYVVVSDANGTLGKRPLSDFTTTYYCTDWINVGYGNWSGWEGCVRRQDIYQNRTCYLLNGTRNVENRTVQFVDNTGCDVVNTSDWAFVSYGSITCQSPSIKIRNINQQRIITYRNGTSSTETRIIQEQIPNVAPVADFDFLQNYLQFTFRTLACSQLGGQGPVCNTYAYDPDGDPITYSWNFGDGTTSTQANPAHSYAASGVYNVTLVVTDQCGATASKTFQVNAACTTTSTIAYTQISDTERLVTTTTFVQCGATVSSSQTVKHQYREVKYIKQCVSECYEVENCAKTCYTSPVTGETDCVESNCVTVTVCRNECEEVPNGYTEWHD